MRVALIGLYEPRWTEQIHDEWTRNVLADNPQVMPAQTSRTRRLMNESIPAAVVSGFEGLISSLNLPDANDRHVLAAAIKAKAAVIVTFNLSDFPAAILQVYGLRPVHPDLFLSTLFDEDPALFLSAVQTHRASLHHPPKDAVGYVQTLKTNNLKELARRLESNLNRF